MNLGKEVANKRLSLHKNDRELRSFLEMAAWYRQKLLANPISWSQISWCYIVTYLERDGSGQLRVNSGKCTRPRLKLIFSHNLLLNRVTVLKLYKTTKRNPAEIYLMSVLVKILEHLCQTVFLEISYLNIQCIFARFANVLQNR